MLCKYIDGKVSFSRLETPIMLTYSLTSVMMLRRDSSSLIPRDNVRFLGEPLLSTVTECMFNVLYLLLGCVGAASEA